MDSNRNKVPVQKLQANTSKVPKGVQELQNLFMTELAAAAEDCSGSAAQEAPSSDIIDKLFGDCL